MKKSVPVTTWLQVLLWFLLFCHFLSDIYEGAGSLLTLLCLSLLPIVAAYQLLLYRTRNTGGLSVKTKGFFLALMFLSCGVVVTISLLMTIGVMTGSPLEVWDYLVVLFYIVVIDRAFGKPIRKPF